MFYEFNLLPVGALTSKPYSFVARPWEIESVSSFDFYDSMMTPIRFNLKGDKVVRVTPELAVTSSRWISDKIRFSYDAFYSQRIVYPHLKFHNKFIRTNWSVATRFWYLYITKNTDLSFFLGKSIDLIDQSSIFNFKRLLGECGSNFSNSNSTTNFTLPYFTRTSNYGLSSLLDNLENVPNNSLNYNVLILGGINFRYELPNLNLYFRKFVKQLKLKIFTIGSFFNPNYQLFAPISLGLKNYDLVNFIFNSLPSILFRNLNAKFFTLVAPSFLTRDDSCSVIQLFDSGLNRLNKFLLNKKFANLQLYNIPLFSTHSTSHLLSFNNYSYKFKYFGNGLKTINCFVNTDHISFGLNDSFNVYCNHHYSENSKFCDLILPTPMPWELENQFYVNGLGNLNFVNFFLKPPQLARNTNQLLKYLFVLIISNGGLLKWLNSYFYVYIIKWFYSFWINSPIFVNKQLFLSKILNLNFNDLLNKKKIDFYSFNYKSYNFSISKFYTSPIADFYYSNYFQTDLLTNSSPMMALSSYRFDRFNYNFFKFKV